MKKSVHKKPGTRLFDHRLIFGIKTIDNLVNYPFRGAFTIALSIGILSTAITLPGCGSSEQRGEDSDIQAIPLGKMSGALTQPTKTAVELAVIKKSFAEAVTAGIEKAATKSPKDHLKSSIVSTIVANNGIPRQQIKEILTELLDPKSTACSGASCSKVFGIKASEVDRYLDDLGDDVANSKRLDAPDQRQTRDQLLGSLRREADEGLDFPCYKD